MRTGKWSGFGTLFNTPAAVLNWMSVSKSCWARRACLALAAVHPSRSRGGQPPAPGIAPKAMDWMHSNSLYYGPQSGDLLVSSRHQDWVFKVDYKNGAGTGNILWRLGLNGDFTFNNFNNDPYPWFSHQHDA